MSDRDAAMTPENLRSVADDIEGGYYRNAIARRLRAWAAELAAGSVSPPPTRDEAERKLKLATHGSDELVEVEPRLERNPLPTRDEVAQAIERATYAGGPMGISRRSYEATEFLIRRGWLRVAAGSPNPEVQS